MKILRLGCRVFMAAGMLWTFPGWAFELDDRPAEPGTWGYRPGEGSAASLNPPPFTWRPVARAAAYRLQVGADPAFENVVYEVAETPWAAHCPDRIFEAGEYYWRYSAVNQARETSGWSQIRHFTVPTELPVFPKPALGEFLARMPAAHPRLFLRPEEIAPFKALTHGALADRWEALIREADKLLAKMPDTAEPPKYPPDTKRKGEAWKKIWWGNRERSVAVGNAASTLAFVHLLSGEEKYARGGHDLLMALCDWDPKGATNFSYNDEAAMPLLYYPSRAYSWIHDTFSPEERERIVAVMTVRGRDCYDTLVKNQHLWKPYNSHANRAWHKLGELAIAFHGEIPEAEQWLDFVTTVFFTCYPAWGVDDGGWHEGAAYWTSYMDRFQWWVGISQSAFNIDPFDKPFFHETGYFGLYTLPPGTNAGAFGDLAPQHNAARIAKLMAALAAGAKNPHWQWYADTLQAKNSGCLGFIAAARGGGLKGKTPEDLPSSRAFYEAGVAVLNTNLLDGTKNIQVHFKSSPFGRQSHGYNSNNSFLLHVQGERALICTGRRDVHGSPHHMRWMWETKSDNAILVNGKGQIPHSPAARGCITLFDTSPQFDVVAGDAAESYENLDRWTRRILFFKPDVILIHDVLSAPEPSTYQWLLHAPGPFEIDRNTARWGNEAKKVQIEFLVPAPLSISQNNLFDPPPHEWAGFELGEWHLTAETTEKAENQQFVTLIRVGEAAASAIVDRARDGVLEVRLSLPQGETVLHLAQDHFRVQGAGIEKAY